MPICAAGCQQSPKERSQKPAAIFHIECPAIKGNDSIYQRKYHHKECREDGTEHEIIPIFRRDEGKPAEVDRHSLSEIIIIKALSRIPQIIRNQLLLPIHGLHEAVIHELLGLTVQGGFKALDIKGNGKEDDKQRKTQDKFSELLLAPPKDRFIFIAKNIDYDGQ